MIRGSVNTKNQVRMKSMLPKTAENFLKMKKGLYLNPFKACPYDIREDALARSLNILSAYGEIMPIVASLKKNRKMKKGPKSK